jgi:HEAT repeat protein
LARKDIEQALEALEAADSSPLKALDALDDLEDHLSLEDQDTLRRLDTLVRRFPGAIAQGIERTLLRVRRENVDWDVLTTASATGGAPPGVSRVLRQAKEALTAPAPYARVAFVERVMAEERFAAGPVLAVQARVEKDPSVLEVMAKALGRLGGPTSLATFKHLLKHEDATVRRGAVEGLGFQRGSQALGLVVEALGDKDPSVLFQAMEVLETSSPAAVLRAIRQTPEALPGQRKAVAYIQGLGKYPGAIELLVERLDSPIPLLSAECLVALAGLGHPEAQRRLEKLSVSTDPRDQQVFALGQRAWPG